MTTPAEGGAPRPTDDEPQYDVTQLPPAPPTTVAVIETIATGAPSRVIDQSDAAGRIATLFADPAQRERIPRLYHEDADRPPAGWPSILWTPSSRRTGGIRRPFATE